jgi:Predicted transcriptional regulators
MNSIKREKLIKIRKSLGYTQKQVADYLGKSRNTYTQYETGKSNPSFEDIVKLKELFKSTDDDIFLV